LPANASAVEFLESRTLLAQYAPDSDFGVGGLVDGVRSDVLLVPFGGRSLAIASFTGEGTPNIVGLKDNGTIDKTVGVNGGITNDRIAANAVGLQTLQEIFIFTTGVDDTSSARVLALNFNGTMDKTFGKKGVANLPIPAAPSAGETFSSFETTSISNSGDGGVIVGMIYNFQTSQAGKIDHRSAIARFSPDGTFDATFGTNGFIELNQLQSSTSVQTLYPPQLLRGINSKLTVISGISGSPSEWDVLRFTEDGTPDTTFSQDGKLNVNDLKLPKPIYSIVGTNDFDLKTTIGGGYNVGDSTNIISQAEFLRLNDDGTLDSTFGTNGVLQIDAGNKQAIPQSMLLDFRGTPYVESDAGVYSLTFDGKLDTTLGDNGFVAEEGFTSTLPESPRLQVIDISSQIILTKDDQIVRLSQQNDASVEPGLETLIIRGTDGDDNISITTDPNDTFVVILTFNGQTHNYGDELVAIEIQARGGNNTISSVSVLRTQVFTGDGNDAIQTGPGLDGITCGGGNDTVDAGDGDDTIRAAIGMYTLHGGAGNDTIFAPASAQAVVFGDDGNDSIKTGNGDDSIYGGGGRDRVFAGFGNDLISGGGGKDSLFSQQGNDRIYGGNGNDALDGGPDNDRLFGQAANDKLFAGSGNDTLDGGAGTDYLAAGAGDDQLTANDGETDSVFGGDGNDTASIDSMLDQLRSLETIS
jgi:Ca2+-binding RTX toxin-like protein